MPFAFDQYHLLYERGERVTAVKGYILSVTAAAMVSAIIVRLVGKNGTGTIIKALAGLFLTLTVLKPLVDVEIDRLTLITDSFREQAEEAVSYGELASRKMLDGIITEQLQTYILDKAKEFGAEPDVELALTDGIPSGIRLSGRFSPYSKLQLSKWLNEELGIPLEAQIWTG